MHKVIADYYQTVPETDIIVLELFREIIESNLENYTIVNTNGFPVYCIHDTWISGFASRSKRVMFYFMIPAIIDKYENRFGKLRTGKSCIEFKETEFITKDELLKVFTQMLKEANDKKY